MLFQVSGNAEILGSTITTLSKILGCSSSAMIHTAIMQRQILKVYMLGEDSYSHLILCWIRNYGILEQSIYHYLHMSTIVITTYGTLGDHLPFIAFAKVLKTRGHQVRMVVNQAIHPYVLKAGLEVVDVGRPKMGPQEVRRYAREWNQTPLLREQSLDMTKFMTVGFQYDLINSMNCLVEACHDADMIISCSLQRRVAAMTAKIYDICRVESCVTPFFLCFPKPGTEDQELSGISPDDKDRNRLILAASPYLYQLVPKYSHAHQTGFWFYEDPDWSSWQPSQELKEFVEQEPKPLVLSYSSVPVENPQEVVEAHVRAAAKLGSPNSDSTRLGRFQ